MIKPQDLKFTGYRRPDGRFGVRNYVLVIPVDDLSNAAAEGVAHNIRGTMALPHPYGRLQFSADLDLTFRTLAGQGHNPNCAAAIVIGIEPNWTDRIVKEIAKTGKPVAGFSIERAGDHKTIEAASRKAKEFVHYATDLQREPFTVQQLTMSTKCGESDTTSGLASNPTVGRAFERLADAGATLVFGETTEVTGGEDIIMQQCATSEIARSSKRRSTIISASSKARACPCSAASRPRATFAVASRPSKKRRWATFKKRAAARSLTFSNRRKSRASLASALWIRRPLPPRW